MSEFRKSAYNPATKRPSVSPSRNATPDATNSAKPAGAKPGPTLGSMVAKGYKTGPRKQQGF